MTNPTANDEVPKSWMVNSIRLTAFPSQAFKREEENWWEDLMGVPPESESTKPREGGWHVVGPYETGTLVLDVTPFRIDWTVGPAAAGAQAFMGTDFPVIAELEGGLRTFYDHMRQWLVSSCPPIVRLALGLTLLLPVSDKLAGYRLLATKLHALTVDPENSSDLIYQINRPRISTTQAEGLKINRLSTWSVLRMKTLFPDPMMSAGLSPRAAPSEPQSACRLQIDLNTDPNIPAPLPKELLADLLDELIAMANEIAAEGDVP